MEGILFWFFAFFQTYGHFYCCKESVLRVSLHSRDGEKIECIRPLAFCNILQIYSIALWQFPQAHWHDFRAQNSLKRTQNFIFEFFSR
jgi:hypothetical protein